MLEIFQEIVLNNTLLIFKKLVKDSTRSRQPLHNQKLYFEKTFFFYYFFPFLFLNMQDTIVSSDTHTSRSIPVQEGHKEFCMCF